MANSPAQSIGRVFIVTPGGTRARGGIGRMVGYIARTWQQPDAPITIVDSYGPGSKAQMPFYFLAAYLHVLFAAMTGQIGILHVHMSERLSVVRKGLIVHLGKAFGIPVVLHLHGADFADYCRKLPPARLNRVKRMMAKADGIITLGGYWNAFVRDELGIDAAKVTVLHNAVPGPATIPEHEIAGPCRILFLGVVCERKGVPTLLAALAHAQMAGIDWQVNIAGNGEVDFYQAEAQRLGLASRVKFLGWVDEAAAGQLISSSDLLVLPSRNEGLPMAILEAMANGLPVVATPVGSIADAITDGQSGFLVPVADAPALADALRRLVVDPALRRQIGQSAREKYLAMFEIGAFNKKLLNIYRSAVQHAPMPDFVAPDSARQNGPRS